MPKKFKAIFYGVSAFIGLIVVLAITAYGYEFIFQKSIEGKVLEINNIAPTVQVTGGQPVYSSAIAIQVCDETVTASAEDRQWYIVQKGQCVKARLYPYVPWDYQRFGTYHDARLVKIVACK